MPPDLLANGGELSADLGELVWVLDVARLSTVAVYCKV